MVHCIRQTLVAFIVIVQALATILVYVENKRYVEILA